jgi:hypothetical protein
MDIAVFNNTGSLAGQYAQAGRLCLGTGKEGSYRITPPPPQTYDHVLSPSLPACCRYVIPVAGMMGFLLLGIDQIAIHLEEPFGILPLEAFCETITRNLEVCLVAVRWSCL